jgi:3-oxoacyl-[acyl-carrier protein] reductase
MGSWQNVRYHYAGIKVLVTGGTSGIGKGIAEAYRGAGAEVAITGTRSSAADYQEDFHGFRFLKLDVEDSANIDRVAAAVPELDVLVNSAGIALYTAGLDEYDPVIFERSLNIHLTSVYRLSAKCCAALSQSHLPGGGSVLSIASMSSLFAFDQTPGYGVAKTGLVSLTRQLAVHWARHRVRVNALAVGLTRSRMSSGFFADPALSMPMLAGVPLGRHGEPRDIAGAALFLGSDAASWITGQTIPVDGGYSIKG